MTYRVYIGILYRPCIHWKIEEEPSHVLRNISLLRPAQGRQNVSVRRDIGLNAVSSDGHIPSHLVSLPFRMICGLLGSGPTGFQLPGAQAGLAGGRAPGTSGIASLLHKPRLVGAVHAGPASLNRPAYRPSRPRPDTTFSYRRARVCIDPWSL